MWRVVFTGQPSPSSPSVFLPVLLAHRRSALFSYSLLSLILVNSVLEGSLAGDAPQPVHALTDKKKILAT